VPTRQAIFAFVGWLGLMLCSVLGLWMENSDIDTGTLLSCHVDEKSHYPGKRFFEYLLVLNGKKFFIETKR